MIEAGKASRAPNWSEMSDDIKIEELKRELQRTQRQVKDLCGFVRMLLRHEHSGGRGIGRDAHRNSNRTARWLLYCGQNVAAWWRPLALQGKIC